MKFSLSTHLFVYEKLSESHLQMASNNGISAIELWCMNPHFDFHTWQNVKSLNNILEKLQLSISSIHTPFYRNFNELYSKKTFSIASDDDEARKIAIEEITLSLKVAADLGAPFAVVHAGNKGDKADENHKTKLTQSLEKLLPIANQLSLTITLENVVSPLSTAEELKSFFPLFSSQFLAACLDTGHAFINKELPKCIKILGDKLKTTHIHDNLGEKDDHLFPLSGKIDWKPLLAAFKHINYNGYWVLEPKKYEHSFEAHFEEMKTAMHKLRALENE